MDDDKIKELFSDFQPQLPPAFQFMSRLKNNMEAVEIVRQHQLALKRRHRTAVAIAAVCGFVTGVILTLLFPMVDNWLASLSVSVALTEIDGLAFNFTLLSWIILAAVSVVTAVSVYEISLARLPLKTDAEPK